MPHIVLLCLKMNHPQTLKSCSSKNPFQNPFRVRPAADDDFVKCRNAHLMTVLVLPCRRRVRPAADDDFVECRNAHLMTVLVLPS